MAVTDEIAQMEWMSYLPDSLAEKPLIQLAIPGSHDSGSYQMSKDFAPSAPSVLKNLAWIPGIKDIFGTLIKGLSTTQSLTIKEQLEAGIRYLDYRVGWRDGRDDFYFVHTVYGTRVEPTLRDINTFLEVHTHEVVILDMQQLREFESEHHKKFIALLKSIFGTKFCARVDIKDVTMKYLWETRKQVICIYQSGAGSQESSLWSSDDIESPWPNTTSSDTCIRKLTGYMDRAVKVTDKFFVCQGVVTPDFGKAVVGNSIYSMTKDLNPKFTKWLSQSSWKNQPNIVIHDFVELGGYIGHVKDLNKRRISD